MTGRVVDLITPNILLPSPFVVDSNVVIARMLASHQSQLPHNIARAAAFFDSLQTTGQQALLTPTAYSEVIHAAIKAIYQRARASHRSELTAHYGRHGGFSWLDLHKLDPTILQAQADVLEEWRRQLVAANIALVDRSDLGPIPSGQRYDRELLDLVVRYGLDTSDATILMEATRIGVHSLVSFDRDMRRAVANFDIYTWLS
ncbi:MAG: hypothetical protein H0W06_08525 [Chloroflexia bacterium]|nr:hypothetical protein [Chloroflexia bacterium]